MDLQGHKLFDLEVTQKDAQYPLHYVTYVPAKCEVVMSISSGVDAFTNKYIL